MNESNQGFEAWLFHPSVSDQVVAGTIFVDRFALHFRSETLSEQIPSNQVVIELGDDGERICFKDPARPDLEIFALDKSLLQSWSQASANHIRYQIQALGRRGEFSRAVRISLCVVAACVALGWLGSWVSGMMVRSMVAGVPVEWEKKFGADQMGELQTQMTLVEDTNLVAQLAALAEPLTRVVSAGRTEFTFHVVDTPMPNAFALPGGHVIVSTGLLELADTPEELLGAMAHEMAHVTQKHAFRRIISAAGPIVICGSFLGSRSGVLDLLGKSSGLLISQSFSQEYEMEADSKGWDYLIAARIDPRGMINMFHKLYAFDQYEGNVVPRAFSSHPSFQKRLAILEGKSANLPRETVFLKCTNEIPVVHAFSRQMKRSLRR